MATIDEVKQMQSQGVSEENIVSTLREKGVPYREISESISQSKITEAVEQPQTNPQTAPPMEQMQPPLEQMQPPLEQMQPPLEQMQPPITQETQMGQPPQNQLPPQKPMEESIMPPPMAPTAQAPPENFGNQPPAQGKIAGMQQSIVQTAPSAVEEYIPPAPGFEGESQEEYGGPYQDEYDEYGYGQGQPEMSSEIISEISEQVVAEKISSVRRNMEILRDFKTTAESKIESVDQRIKKIEKIIDTLQTTILRKVGDYVTDVSDLKSELIETQKTFKKLGKKEKTTKRKSKK
ncbi:hypothetical protein CXX78_01155 [Candidatus Parvarchaeota archaeon]|nr:MAG: hypothetical protein CXX78_01155 [Candidatus Parvarchaeota archaeon]